MVTALEGPVVPHEFVHSPAADAAGAELSTACAVRNAWLAATEASQRVLDQTTIQELLEQQLTIRTRRGDQERSSGNAHAAAGVTQ